MEKSGYSHQEFPPLVGDEKRHGIKRKPVAAPAPAHVASISKETDIEQSLPPRYNTHDTFRPRTHASARPTTFFSHLQTRWTLLTRRTRYIIIGVTFALLALTIGLAAGLSSRSHTQNLPLPSSHGGPYTGDLTFYDPALGACGFTNSGTDNIVAVSHIVFDAVSVGSNPNANPLCGRKLRVRKGEKSVDLTVVDRCTGCKSVDIDTTRGVFRRLAEISEGRVVASWSWLEDVPGA